MYYIIYKTTNNITGKFYIGKRKTDNLDDGYLGSGLILKYSVKKYGRASHSRSILHFCDTYESMGALERIIVNEDLLKDPLCMNLKIGGDGGLHGKEREMWTPELRKQVSKSISETWKDPKIRKLRNDAQKISASKSKSKLEKSINSKLMWASKEFRNSFEARKTKIFTKDYAQKMSIAVKEAFEDPLKREKLSVGMKKTWSDPIYHNKMNLKRLETANTQEFKKAVFEGKKKASEKRFQELKDLNLNFSVDGWQESVIKIFKSKNPKRWLQNNKKRIIELEFLV